MIHVLHVGKTGGTAVKAVLQRFPDKFRLHPHTVRLCDCSPGERVFVAVRHPLDRFVSSFNSRLRKGAPRYFFEWSDAEAEAFRHFANPNDLGEALSSLNPLRRRRAQRAMLSIRHVRSRLSFWLGSTDYLRARNDDLVIGETRTLQSDFENLLKLVGLQPIALSTDPIAMHSTPSGMTRHLSPTAKSNLSHWYAEDFAIYETATSLRCQAAAEASSKAPASPWSTARSPEPSTETYPLGTDANQQVANNPC
jgi:hypothetical protein